MLSLFNALHIFEIFVKIDHCFRKIMFCVCYCVCSMHVIVIYDASYAFILMYVLMTAVFSRCFACMNIWNCPSHYLVYCCDWSILCLQGHTSIHLHYPGQGNVHTCDCIKKKQFMFFLLAIL